MTYHPPRRAEVLSILPDTHFQNKDLKERLNGGTLASLKNAGYIEKVSQEKKIITWRLTEKGARRRAQR